MAEMYLSEAFQSLKELNEEVFDLNAEGTAELKDFVSDSKETSDVENIIDPLAATEEELQDSYIGKVILDCSICQSKIYKNPDEVIINEDGDLVNAGDECPYCRSVDGYKIIGEVAPYSETEVDVEVTPKEDDKDGKNEDGLNESKSLKAQKDAGEYDRRAVEKEYGLEDGELDGVSIRDAEKITGEEDGALDRFLIGVEIDDDLKESIDNLTIDTDKETINVSTTEKSKNGEEMVAPLNSETENKFKSEESKEDNFKDVDIDEFDETEFDGLGENYLKRCYENVASYKTTKGSVRGNHLKLEGVITFKSGKKAKTNFMFEAKTINKNGKVKLIGENKQFARGNKSFTLSGKVNKNKLIAESLTYNYRAKDAKTGNSKRLYGTVKR